MSLINIPKAFNRPPLLNKNHLILTLGVFCVVSPYIISRIIGWLTLSFIIFKKPAVGLMLTFFFAPFFSYDFGNFNLFFTLKPFQTAFLISLAAVAIKQSHIIKEVFYSLRLKENVFLLIFILASYVYAFFGDHLLPSIMLSLNLTVVVSWYLLAVAYLKNSPDLIRKCIYCLLLGFCIILLYVSLDNIFCNKGIIYKGHNYYSNILLILIFLLATFYLIAKNRFFKILFLIFSVATVCHILIAASRTAIFAYIVVLPFFVKDMIARKAVRHAVIFIILNVVCLTWLGINNATTKACFKDFFDLPRAEISAIMSRPQRLIYNIGSEEAQPGVYLRYTISTRYERWRYTIKALIKNPLMGVGFKNDMHAYHNLYLEMISRAGIIGGGSFLFFLFLWIRRVSASTMGLSTRVYFFIQKGLLYGIAAWLIQSFTETFFLQFYIWAVLALGTAIAFLPFEDDKIG
jgi:hypothetical protein